MSSAYANSATPALFSDEVHRPRRCRTPASKLLDLRASLICGGGRAKIDTKPVTTETVNMLVRTSWVSRPGIAITRPPAAKFLFSGHPQSFPYFLTCAGHERVVEFPAVQFFFVEHLIGFKSGSIERLGYTADVRG